MKFEDRINSLILNSLVKSYNVGISEALKESNFMTFVWATSSLENHCKLCNALNGVEFTAAEVAEMFPAHVNCLCHLLPKVGSY